jgi:FMN phosphatase YigB (HAD superfamily)
VTLTLLLDLDGTLLGNEMDTFLPAYLQALSGHLSGIVEPNRMIATLLAATRRMVENQDPDCTLQEVFDDAFYPALGVEKAELRPAIDAFYERIFPTLRALTQFRPEAVELVDAALDRGYQIAIATNPLFPRSACLQRVAWAGFDPQVYPFTLISTCENFHFAKPRSAYYAEIMASLGWPEGPVLMVGDDLERDIEPAVQMGIKSFWITTQANVPDGYDDPSGYGSLADLLPWLDALPAGALQPDARLPGALLATLSATPAALDSLCRKLTPDAWRRRPADGQWCPTEVICHMRDVEREVNLPRIKTILGESNPFIPGKDTDPWAEQRQYIQQDGTRAFQSFISTRWELLNLLRNNPPEAWKRTARHAILGPTDLTELVGIIAEHDRLHIRQVQKDLQTDKFSG